ncbi:unnamed protein product [Linum tenue]|uniref:Uncharacterized protein n=1 Tax=Linum tenue TaxID=586396 RepID=A0AAV0HGV4_9ROSI|nr:unnamed protein product [Linum tenue]CAI0384447.1 unnamed protein product [Linum tenue]
MRPSVTPRTRFHRACHSSSSLGTGGARPAELLGASSRARAWRSLGSPRTSSTGWEGTPSLLGRRPF